MAILGDVAPGPEVGRAYKFLLEKRLDEGPLGPEAAEPSAASLVGRGRSRPVNRGAGAVRFVRGSG